MGAIRRVENGDLRSTPVSRGGRSEGGALVVRARRVVAEGDVEAMRLLRNECARFMTGFRGAISPKQQRAWWASLDAGAWRCFLYRAAKQDTPVAYGLLRRREGKWWVSGGVAAPWRGQGVGRQVFADLCRRAPSTEVWLDVWDWNTKAVRLYESLGFEAAGSAGGIITMRRSGSRRRDG